MDHTLTLTLTPGTLNERTYWAGQGACSCGRWTDSAQSGSAANLATSIGTRFDVHATQALLAPSGQP